MPCGDVVITCKLAPALANLNWKLRSMFDIKPSMLEAKHVKVALALANLHQRQS